MTIPAERRIVTPVVIQLETAAADARDRVEAVQQLPQAFALWLTGMARMHSPEFRDHVFGVAELATTAALAYFAIRVIKGKPFKARVSVVDVLAAAMLFAEWGDRTAHGHRWYSPVLLTAVVSLTIGILPWWFPNFRNRRRKLRIDAEGLSYRYSLFRRFKVKWEDMRGIVEEQGKLVFTVAGARDGVIRLGKLKNGEEVREAVMRAAGEMGIPVTV